MRPLGYAVAVTALLLSASSLAEPSSYAGEQTRAIKALSEQEIGDYLAGKGMGLAKAAELNGYPGPAHVLDLAAELRLSPEQRARTEALHAQMRSRAIAAGRALVDAENALDRLFASKTATVDGVRRTVREAAERQAEVRFAHLEAHLAQAAILTPEQIAKYAELRGYGAAAPHRGHAHGSH